MKGTYLGEFQEIVLLTVLILDEEAYGVRIQGEIKQRLKRDISRGALHAALTRLEEKGFSTSRLGGATADRGGRRKRLYQVTHKGKAALTHARTIRESLWQEVPGFSLDAG